MKLNLSYVFILPFFLIQCTQAQKSKTLLYKKDISIIKEAFHLKSKLAPLVWDKWTDEDVPLLYNKNGYDFLINHNNPPEDFTEFNISGFQKGIYYRKNSDSKTVQATFPINNIATVVMSAPSDKDDKCEWILKAVHEMFHVYQAKNKSKKLKQEHFFNLGKYHYTNELNFPFDYYNEKILAVHKLEADRVFKNIEKEFPSTGEVKILQRRFADIYLIHRTIMDNNSFINFKSHMEWKEGVARYVEQKIAELSSEKSKYTPTEEFIKEFPEANYQKLSNRYQRQSAISPIRFVGEGVIGRVMFYYMGMGKAYLLDRIKPNWKEFYFTMTLDEQIIGEEQFLSCKVKVIN